MFKSFNKKQLKDWRWWSGPTLIVIAALVFTILSYLTNLRLPISTPIFLLIIVYTAFTGGLSSALLSVTLTTIYHLVELVRPGGLLHYRGEDIFQVIFLILSAPLIVIMVSRLRSRAETTLAEKLQQEQAHSVELKAVLEKQRQAEEEVRLLNSHLEQRVKERTAQLQEQEQILRKQTRQIQSILDNLEERVAQRTAELSVLLEISQNVAANLNLPSIKGVLTGQLNKLMNFDLFSLYRLHNDGSLSLLDTSLPGHPASLNGLGTGLTVISPRHKEAVATRTPVIVDDFTAEMSLTFAGTERQPASEVTSPGSVMYVPLVVKEEVVGLLVLSYHEPGYYTPYHAQLAQAVGTQVATAIENARLYDQAQDIAALEERQRLARELHDSTSQVLFSIQLGSRALRNFLEEGQLPEAKETVNYLISLAKGGLDEMRALIFDLRPESIEKEGLLGALQKQIVALKDRYSFEVEVRFSRETEPELPLKYKEAIYRIAREALHNVVKHANTERVSLELTWDSQLISLVVRDYGIGFEPDAAFTGHYGLHTMQERTQKLPGAKLSIESKPGEGTRVCLNVPLAQLSLTQTA